MQPFLAAWISLSVLASVSSYELPAAYSLTDPHADHDYVARQLAKDDRLAEAIAGFKAACRFAGSPIAFGNLGVALMRSGDFPASYKAFKEALQIDSSSEHAKENLLVLYDHAGKRGMGKKELERQGKQALLGLVLDGDGATSEPSSAAARSLPSPEVEAPPKPEARVLSSAEAVAKRGRELMKRGERRLGRGYMSLALHLDPFLANQLPSWFADSLEGETLHYWEGNLFVGHDKTYLENLAAEHFTAAPGSEVHQGWIYSWRNLQIVGLSCCGIDNVAALLSRSSSHGHPYVVPFLHLTPDYVPRLKADNQAMYHSFKSWWESSGRKRMPDPAITYLGHGKWEWTRMKVVLPQDRVSPGWRELTQAVLCYRVQALECARASAIEALRRNPELAEAVDELVSGFQQLAPPEPFSVPHPAAAQKYIVVNNAWIGLGNLAVVMISAHALAKITGRTLLVNWNVNMVSRHAFSLVDQPGVRLIGDGAYEAGVFHEDVKILYLFHLMDPQRLADTLELLGCSDLSTSLDRYSLVTVSSNLFFAPILRTNPHTPKGFVPEAFSEMLAGFMRPSAKASKRAVSFANRTEWGENRPIIAVHVRAREEGEDNDDWPTADSPDKRILEELWRCLQVATDQELGEGTDFDVFVAATTEKARSQTVEALRRSAKGAKRVLTLPKLDRNRRTGAGAIDAMAEALLISRADIFVRLVVGTTGFSTFAYLANALRAQPAWADAAGLAPLRSPEAAPNYVVTEDCGLGRCFSASPDVRMADVSFHGQGVTGRSCGNVIDRISTGRDTDVLCGDLVALDDRMEL